MGIYKKLAQIQCELTVPKSREIFLKKGTVNYRKLEDIMKALKPLLNKHKTCVLMTDEIEAIPPDKVYIKSTIKFIDLETEEFVESTAFAREDNKEDGEGPKTTLSVSSYARKSALVALFCIDDSDEGREWIEQNDDVGDDKHEEKTLEQIEQDFSMLDREQIIRIIHKEMKQKNITLEEVCSKFKVEKIENLCLNSLARIYLALYKAKQKK